MAVLTKGSTSYLESNLPRLLDGEQIIKVEDFNFIYPQSEPSALHELTRLAGVKSAEEIGDFGPVVGGQAFDHHQSIDHLRRFEVVFGRDSLRVAMDLLNQYPKLARNTLLKLAELQGLTVNIAREEEPGRIIHEARDPDDPIAVMMTKKEGRAWPDYGSIDATIEFVRTLAAYCRLQGYSFLDHPYIAKNGESRTMRDSFTEAVNWMVNRMNKNKEGLIEFQSMNPHSKRHVQAWKDSWDSYFHANGDIANFNQGIASIEVQRAAYDALCDAIELYELHMDMKEEAKDLRSRADNLKTVILEKFWTEDRGGYFILGTDRDDSGNLRQLKILTSNMGHMLRSPLLLKGDNPEIVRKREAVITHLFAPDMLNQSGIRTLSTAEYRYRPGSYHNGSVWLWDNYLILQGLDQHGYHRLAGELEKRIKFVISSTRLFPEFVRGDDGPKPIINSRIIDAYDSINKKINRIEEPPQEVQAWTVAAILSMEQRKMLIALSTSSPHTLDFEMKILKSIKA